MLRTLWKTEYEKIVSMLTSFSIPEEELSIIPPLPDIPVAIIDFTVLFYKVSISIISTGNDNVVATVISHANRIEQPLYSVVESNKELKDAVKTPTEYLDLVAKHVSGIEEFVDNGILKPSTLYPKASQYGIEVYEDSHVNIYGWHETNGTYETAHALCVYFMSEDFSSEAFSSEDQIRQEIGEWEEAEDVW